MKHLIKKYAHWTIACSRPGCIASLQGGMVGKMSKKEIKEFFPGECPATFTIDSGSLFGKEAVEHTLKQSRKNIKDWEKIIEYWEKNNVY